MSGLFKVDSRLYEKFLLGMPQTPKMSKYVGLVDNHLDYLISQNCYTTMEKLSELLSLFNPRHKSLAYALRYVTISDIMAGKVPRTAIVLKKDEQVCGHFVAIMEANAVKPDKHDKLWHKALFDLGYRKLPNGELLLPTEWKPANRQDKIVLSFVVDSDTHDRLLALQEPNQIKEDLIKRLVIMALDTHDAVKKARHG